MNDREQPSRPDHWPLMPPPPGEEDEEGPHLRTSFLVATIVLGIGVSVGLALPLGLVALAGGCGLVAGVAWHFGGRLGTGIAAVLVTSFAGGFLRPLLDGDHGPLTAGLIALLPGMAGFSAVMLIVRLAEARAEQRQTP